MLLAAAPEGVKRIEQLSKLVAGASAEQHAQVAAYKKDEDKKDKRQRADRVMSVGDDGVARINIVGSLSPEYDFWAEYFDIPATAYRDILAALSLAEADQSVGRGELYIDSPGGYTAGMREVMVAVNAFGKPIDAIASRADSAAYGIASQADSITATGPDSEFGSVGVVASVWASEYFIEITSSNAPNKRPDPKTEEGRAVIRAQLDEYEDIFTSDIAKGRNTTQANVQQNFGRGGTMLAARALENGLIDRIGAASATLETTTQAKAEANSYMTTLADLKAKHPEVYAQAKAEGAAEETERVNAHFTLARACGDEAVKLAVENVESGEPFSASVSAKYQALGMEHLQATAVANSRKQDAEGQHQVDANVTQKTEAQAAAEELQAAVKQAYSLARV